MSCFSLSMKVPAIVSETEAALKQGFSVVIGLQTTGEVYSLWSLLQTSAGQFLVCRPAWRMK